MKKNFGAAFASATEFDWLKFRPSFCGRAISLTGTRFVFTVYLWPAVGRSVCLFSMNLECHGWSFERNGMADGITMVC